MKESGNDPGAPDVVMAEDSPGATTGSPSIRWSGRTRGGYFGNWFFVQLIRRLGLRWAYAWLMFVAAYFTVASPSAFRSSVRFLERVLGPKPFWKWPVLVYRHFYSYGVSLIDRIAVIGGQITLQCQFEGEAMFLETLSQGKGILLLGAHVGSWEIGGHLLGRHGLCVNVVVLEKDEERIRRLLDGALRAKRFRMIATDNHPLRSIPIAAALRRGEIVALLGDRSFGGADMSVPFLGGTARFPVGPYLLAAASGAPIFQVFAVRERLSQYRFFSFPPTFVDREALRAGPESLRPHVVEYAGRLASVARQYPFQWYNFYPFWEKAPDC